MQLKIKDITDQVFNHLDRVVMTQVLTLFESEAFDTERNTLQGETLQSQNEAYKAVLLKQSEAMRDLSRNLLTETLLTTVPGSDIWYKGDQRPGGDLTWVVSPFEYALMAPMTTSVALQQKEELVLSVLVRMNEEGIHFITGEKDDGAWNGKVKYGVNDSEMSARARGMQVIPAHPRRNGEMVRKLSAFRRKWECETLVNVLPENASSFICHVASGKDDFALGLNASYHDIAAAICIAEQAGAVVTDFEGSRAGLYSGTSFFCANKKIHQQFMEC